MARVDPMLGMLVPLTEDQLVELVPDGTTFESQYTQAGAGPGIAEADHLSRWRPVVTAAQDQGVEYVVVQGGYPGREGMSVAVRPAGGTEEQYQSWSDYVLVTSVTVPVDNYLETWNIFACAVRSDTGEIVIVATEAGTTDGATYSYDPRSETWTVGYDWTANQGLSEPICMAADPVVPGRVLLWSGKSGAGIVRDEGTVAYYSDDSGVTWQVHAVGLYDVQMQGLFTTRAAVGVSRDEDWLMFNENWSQYASSDNGVTWEFIGSFPSIITSNQCISTIARGPRGYVVSYVQDANAYPCVRVLPSARTPVDEVVEVVIEELICDDVVIAADYDGTLFAWVFADDGTQWHQETRVFRSVDGGYTWVKFTRHVWANSGGTDHPSMRQAIACCSHGHAYLIGRGSESSVDAWWCVQFGGWSNVDAGSVVDDTVNRSDRMGWIPASAGAANGEGVCLIPFDGYTASGWTRTVGGVVAADTLDDGGIHSVVAGVGNTLTISYLLGSTTIEYAAGHARIRMIAAGGGTTLGAYLQVDLQDGTDGYSARIRMGNSEIDVYDVGAGVSRASITEQITGTDFELRWHIWHGAITVWWRPVGGADWTRVASAVTLTAIGGGAVQSRIFLVFPSQNNTRELVLQMLAYALLGNWRQGLDVPADLALTPADGVRGIVHGRHLPPAGAGYPVPLLTTPARDLGFMHAFGGPAYTGELGAIPVKYRWPIEAIQPDYAPSPRLPWRATGTDEVNLVYEAPEGKPRYRGGAIALVTQRASFGTAEFYVDDGAGGWSSLGILGKRQSVSYDLSGCEVRPSGSTTLGEYIPENALVDGYMELVTGSGNVARRIVRNSAGYFAASSGQPVRIEVAGIDGTESATGTGWCIYPNGMYISYPAGDSARRYYRIRIPSGQLVPADRGEDGETAAYDAGILFVAQVIGIGTEPDWSTTRRYAIPAVVSRRRDGSPTMTRTGQARRIWSYTWPASDAYAMRRTDALADFIGGTGRTVAIGTEQDAWSEVPAVVDRLQGRPLVLVARLPYVSNQLTSPDQWIYGLAVTDQFELVNQVGGWESISDLLAMGTLTVEEIS